MRLDLRRIAVLAFVVGAVAVPAAHADGGKGKGRDKVVVITDDGKKIVFVEDDRNKARTYWHSTYGRGSCPPGLVRVGRSCMTRGYARKRYVVGRTLPHTVVVEVVPKSLLSQLRQPPYGYKYVMVDGDILLLRASNGYIADAIINLFD